VRVAFDCARWAADCELVDEDFEDDVDFDEEPQPARAMARPAAASSASVLIMIKMMSDRPLAFPATGAPDLLYRTGPGFSLFACKDPVTGVGRSQRPSTTWVRVLRYVC
jgi:hypothetical protein